MSKLSAMMFGYAQQYGKLLATVESVNPLRIPFVSNVCEDNYP